MELARVLADPIACTNTYPVANFEATRAARGSNRADRAPVPRPRLLNYGTRRATHGGPISSAGSASALGTNF